ncbi:MAG: hypothetical protein RLZZ21_2564 [Planctomycetota bacterium]
MPPPSSSQLWDLLAQSRLVAPTQLQSLRQSHASLPNAAADDAKAVARWLVQHGAITIWQARRLIAGKTGPFFIGDYRLLDQRPGDGEAGLFTARHEPSGRDVSLVLLNGRRCVDPIVWTEIVNRTMAANRAVDPLLSRTWALEQAGANRFIVCEHVTGETLAAELARRGPLPLVEAGQIALAVATALAEVHAAGSVHGGVSLDAVLRDPARADGTAAGVRLLQFPLVGDPHAVPLRPLIDTPDQVSRLGTRASFVAPELTRPGVAADTRSDVYALGCLLHALVSGRPPCWKGEPRSTLLEAATVGPAPLAPPAVPIEVATLIGYLTARDPAARYQYAGDAAQAIAACFGLAAPAVAAMPESTVGAVDAAADQAWPDVSAAPVAAVRSTSDSAVKRNRGNGAALIAALLVGLGLSAAGGYYALSSKPAGGGGPKPSVEPPPGGETTDTVDRGTGEQTPASAKSSETSVATETAVEGKGGAAAAAVEVGRRPPVQVVDDPNLPWESPTKGLPPTLAYLPPNAQWLLLARPAAMLADDEANLFVRALGPEVEGAVAAAAALAGCEPADLESVQAGWLAPSTEELVMGLTLRLVESKMVPDDEGFRSRAWAAKRSEEIAGETVFVGGGRVFWLPERERGRVLVVAPPPLMEEIIADAAATESGREKGGLAVSLDRDLETLVEMLDAERHLMLAGLPHHLLTNGRPTALVGPLARLAEPLDAFCGEDVKAAAVSLHFADDFYAEVDAVTSLDLPAAKAAPVLAERLAQLPDDVEAYCTRLAPDPYGGRLVMRLPGMLRSLTANLRAGAEPNGVVLNVVLPRPAGHNIALAAELALAQSPLGVAPVAAATASAATDALGKLEKKMTLVFAKDTLEKTIQMISDEVGVPMEIVGPDLQLEGITKNQSFGLDEQDKSAKAILKVVLQKANPDGKLVYVVTKQDGAEAILITTRAAAEKRRDTLAPGQ